MKFPFETFNQIFNNSQLLKSNKLSTIVCKRCQAILTQFNATKKQFTRNQETLKKILHDFQPNFVDVTEIIVEENESISEEEIEKQDVETFTVESLDECEVLEEIKHEIIETEPYVLHEVRPEFAVGQFSIIDEPENAEMETGEDIANPDGLYKIIGFGADDHENQHEYTVKVKPELIFPCQICPRTFESPQLLENHIFQHANRFSCGEFFEKSVCDDF